MLSSIIEFFRRLILEQISKDPAWTIIAFAGQLVFAGRFILQWIVSEYKKRSTIPVAFWYLSLGGSFILLCYSIHIMNIVFILGFSLNTFIYIRNLHLIYAHAKTAKATAENTGD